MMDRNGLCSDPAALAEKMKSKLLISPALDEEAFAYSQPTDLRVDMESEDVYHLQDKIMSFSQPNTYLGGDSQSPEKMKFDKVHQNIDQEYPRETQSVCGFVSIIGYH